MKRFFVAVVLCLVMVATAWATTPPLTTLKNMPVPSLVVPLTCIAEPAYAAMFVKDAKEYVLYITKTKFVLLDNDDSNDLTPVWLGTVNEDNETLTVLREMKYKDYLIQYPESCTYFSVPTI